MFDVCPLFLIPNNDKQKPPLICRAAGVVGQVIVKSGAKVLLFSDLQK